MPTIAPIHRASLARAALAAFTLLSLSGCDIPGLGPDPRVLQREAEAQAIGGACRHAGRGLEDCFTLNPRASKAQVFAGWREMDQYMRENKVEGVPSVLTQAPELSTEAAIPTRRASPEATATHSRG